MDTLFDVRDFDAVKELRREYQMRAKVYAHWIRTGRMDRATAQKQTDDLLHALTRLQACVMPGSQMSPPERIVFQEDRA